MDTIMKCFKFFAPAFSIVLIIPGMAQRRGQPPDPIDAFRFRFVGPQAGNRIASIAGVPGDINIYYAGAASGGIFKSNDGGFNWTPIFDDQPVTAIGSLAVAPSNPEIVWAGTGEAWAIRDSDVMGNGIYKSVDAGRTWQHMGLDETGRIGRLVIHPTNPNIVFACALGRMTGPQQERGVYRTTDGGAHWERVLFVNENTGCSGLSMDAKNPSVIFAGAWQSEMHTYGEYSGGPGSGVFVSRDGGSTWNRVADAGLPHSPLGKIDVAVAPSNSNRVYALIQTADQGSLWRSDDGGTNWKAVNWDRALIGRAGYYIHLAVSPSNDKEVMVANSSFHVSIDAGETFRAQNNYGGDTHDIWWDSSNADRFVITHDAGMNITTSHGRGFNRVTLPIGQMYHVSVDNQTPYFFYTNMQDSTTMRGPSTQIGFGGFGRSPEPFWDRGMGGCESGFTYADPTDPNIVWATCYGDEVTRCDARTKLARSVSPWKHTLDSPPDEAKYRCHWTAPLAIDPFDHNTVYFGCQVIFRTTNGGDSWKVISPDLSTQDPTRNAPSGGIVGDNLGQFYGEVVFAIAPSTIQKGLIWAGTNDGKIWYTKDAGAHWNDVTKNVTGIPVWGTVTSIQPSFFDAATAYASVDAHLMDNRDPFVFKTTDFGAHWTNITSNLPHHTLSYVRVIAEDPNCKGLLFAGTGNALYYSLDDGGHWVNQQTGLPHAPVSWAVVQKQTHDLVVSTYGRGIYILDDITPLEQMARGAGDTSVSLFQPRETVRILGGGRAFVNYKLKNPAKSVQAEILDANGKVVRTLRPGTREGLNRVQWDLHYDAPTFIALRTTPPENPHIWEEPRFRGQSTRPITHWGAAQAEVGPVAAPGKYTVKLTVDGEQYSQSFEVVRDPGATGSNADLQSQVNFQLKIRDDINNVSQMVNLIEVMRKQMQDMETKFAPDSSKADLLKTINAMDQKMQTVEYKLVSKALTTSDDKYFIAAYKVYFDLIWLNGEVGTGAGDVAGGANYAPTETARGLLADIEKDLATAKAEYTALMDRDVPTFNRTMVSNGLAPLSAAPPPSGPGEN